MKQGGISIKNIYVYQTSPNQKIVVTNKARSDREHLYSICNIQAVLSAATNLSDRAFKLYARMNLHQNEHRYALSPTAIRKEIGMSDKRYRDAVNELIEKGYLVQYKEHSNIFVFYEDPQRNSDDGFEWAVDSVKTDVQPVQDIYNIPIKQTGNPSKMVGEIVQYNTSNTDSTKNNTCNWWESSLSDDFKLPF